MKSLATALLLAACGLFPLSLSATEPDKTTQVPDDDTEMNAAIAKARSLLPQFWKAKDAPKAGDTTFALKVRIKYDQGHEHFWLNDIEKKDGKIFGTINNDPEFAKQVKMGQRIEILPADISDWMYVRDGKIVGNYTLRALFKTMPPEEAAKYKALLAEP